MLDLSSFQHLRSPHPSPNWPSVFVVNWGITCQRRIPMTTENALALEIAALDQQIKRDSEKLALKKAELIAQVGTAGAVIETALGKVTVTQQTVDRKTGQ